MATTPRAEYEYIKVTGPVSVEPVDAVPNTEFSWRILIMGPTGAGKSSFIEALGLKNSSKISSNGLDGCTQAISTYTLSNATHKDGSPIYIVDSPGFADAKISEMAIVSMLQKWIKGHRYFSRVFYLTPVTRVRLPGSQRQVLRTFQALTGVNAAGNVTIVTTMWDTIWGEQAEVRAEGNYEQLQNEIWKDFIQEGAQIAKFLNTQECVLSLLNEALGRSSTKNFLIEGHDEHIKASPFEQNILVDLQDRIQNLRSHIPTLRNELSDVEALGDELLESVLRPRLIEAEADLARFQKELYDSGLLPPTTPALAAPTREAPGPNPVDHAPHGVSLEDVAPLTMASPSLLAESPRGDDQLDNVEEATDFHLVPMQHTHQSRRFRRVMELIKCWGKDVGDRHDV
ncbi:hypothetical protein BJ165DRAFT_1534078 [Panaeolus papilionaceus]|nr:hypothetical protein BJ165DRAFT_1534078 [Panaeolus papilionaceus]